ncbi:N-substituted formamide deformylase precursor [uncultured Eubacterium sp.]|uniref:amidohydrolase n=1 Tax=Brotomerdimonas butyrica TaxID=2981721 RepID=UPI000822C22E|nr:amidohydrolase [Brotomerdimonas butyrica]MCU6754838.1 amidohydrolase [Brotomerdimonas butyrica]SCG95640.1 N-substituted formamide deformylase precursor [uncultured Eubacterium sp.]
MTADMIIKGNAIFDSVSDKPFAGFVAVKGNRIAAVGKEMDSISQYAGDDTKIIDAGDRLVMPGFHDSHTHLILAGMYKTYPNLGSARSEEEAAAMLKEYYDSQPGDGWVYGFNWYHVFWDKKELPRKETLDRYFPDRPVFLINAEAHGAWVNSLALEIAGVTADTPDPFGGEIARDENGEPTGFLYESAIEYVAAHALIFTEEQEKTFLRKYMADAAELGITGVVDVQPYFGKDLGSLDVYTGMESDGELTVRITAAANLLGDLDEALENSKKYCTEKVRAHMLKQFVDGVITTHTALLLEDYTDAPGNRGTQLSELEKIDAAVQEGHKRGLWIKIHAIGDRAIRFTIDSYEKAIKTYGANGCRHAIEHVEMVTDSDIKRFGQLGLIPSVQPEHIGLMPTWEGEEYRVSIGEERAGRTWPFRSLLESAGVLAIGSDCPVVDNNPFYAIHRGVTRLHDDGLPEGGWNPTQKLTVADILRGYTLGSAYGIGREDELGTLEEGKFADIAVIDRNLFEAEPEDIRSANVDMTIMDGEVIFERA